MAKFLSKVKFNFLGTYIARVRGSVESNLFKSAFGWVNNSLVDLTEAGELSCGAHVSGILAMTGLIKEMHLTVDGVLKDMEQFGWYEIKNLKPGAILLWEPKITKQGRICAHVGFCIDNLSAISNSETSKVPIQHSLDYDGTRKIEKIFWHPKLD